MKERIIEYILNEGKKMSIAVISAIFTIFVFFGVLFSAPRQFPTNDMVIIPKGISVLGAGKLLEGRHVIDHPTIFTMLVKIISSDNTIIAGGYLFTEKENLFTVARRLARGDHKLDTTKVTFPEGSTVKEMAKICQKELSYCNEEEFITLGSGSEGYLYPDTYFFLQSTPASEVINTLRQTFEQRFRTLEREIRDFGKPAKDILIMASILEKEAQNFENQKAVASVLWKRLSINMVLQVDATLDYALNKNTYELTTKDLATTSPYNTYIYKGLPQGPISNPGIEAIKAALSAGPTKYLYYLTDRAGNFYFAETHDEHVKNKQLFLNK